MAFSRQEYWSGLPFPTPGDLPNPGIESVSLALTGEFFTTASTWEAHSGILLSYKKKKENAICSNMGEPRDYHIKSNKEKYHMSLICGI